MAYEKEAKIVFYLWGIFIMFDIIYNLLFFLGIGVPEDFSDHFFGGLMIQRIIIDTVILSLIILGYKGRIWAYCGFMIVLGYTCIGALLTLGTGLIELLSANTSMDTGMYMARFMGPSLGALLRGMFFYVLYRYRKKEILLMIKDYRRAARVILPLWCVLSIIKIIGRLSYMYRTKDYLDLFKNEPHFSMLFIIIYVLTFIFAVSAYKRKKWAYLGCMISLGSGLIIELWKLVDHISNFGIDTVQFAVLPGVGTIFAFILSLYILYKGINDVFSS
ncbi:MAG: hypothetical protein J7L10_01955 [Methanomicrobia archaeon]|nr:hypothetical protein [Methanomicrobia archaeon]